MDQKEEKILSMQCESTRKAMLRTESERIDFWMSPLPKTAQCKDEDGNIFVNSRPISFQEAKVESALRYHRGLYVADMRNEGDACSVAAKRENAVQAFMAKITPQELKKRFESIMNSIKEEVPVLGYRWNIRNKQN